MAKRGRKKLGKKNLGVYLNPEAVKWIRRMVKDRVVFEIDGEYMYSRSRSELVESLLIYIGRSLYLKNEDAFRVTRKCQD